MIPSVLAQQVRRGVEDFLHTTFPISTPFFHGLLDRLFAEEGGVFKGPYLSIQLPLRQSTSGPDFFPDVPLRFKPYVHQERAFQRLSGTKPRSTIVATGTGSGKTESFLHPILAYCYKHRGEPGIKAILIYPMNALASDQALRLARTIWHNPNLKGHVTAGLFVGQSEREPHTRMGEDSIITNKDTLRLMPPDILLTNYKMLDYLLVRPRDFPLWKDNGSETLRYLVVDELHTFDGAQGADLGCLVRRLKNRLATPPGFLCCVGTSATLGSDTEQHALRDYAATTFGEAFDEDAIITESRLSAGEFLEHSLISRVDIVPPDKALDLAPESYESYPAYIRGQYQSWFDETLPQDTFADAFDAPGWRVTLGRQLKEHRFFQNLLKVLGGKVRRYEDILLDLEKVTPELRQADPVYRENLLHSLLALVSEALVWVAESPQDRTAAETNSTKRPTAAFLHVRLQHWMRELRRMVCDVRPTPQLRFADDLTDEQRKRHLPIVHCRECGSTGWAGLRKPTDNSIQADLQSFYIGFFRNDAKVTFLFPEAGDVRAQKLDGNVYHLCGACLGLTTRPEVKTCPTCDHDELIRVFVPNSRTRRQQRVVGTHDCPYCGAASGLTLIGSRAASLTSVQISQLYASSFNNDKKLLTFSDSVQDAAHRAGFFGARTYRFNFRGALQQYVQTAGEGRTLAELPSLFIQHWSDRMGNETYITTFIAPNMLWFADYEALLETGRVPDSSRLRQDVDQRVAWEILSEYGFTARIGRTLEKTSSSVVHLDPTRLDATVQHMLEPLRNEIGELRGLDEASLRRFVVGLIVHLKDQGAIFHPELDTYIEEGGNPYLLTRIPWLPNFGPQTRVPTFLTTRLKSRFDRLFSSAANQRTWYQGWVEKCFVSLNVLISAVADRFYELALRVLVEERVLAERTVKGGRVWGIQPEALRVSCQVVQFRCQRCGHNASVAAAERSYWDAAPCLRLHCSGTYQAQDARPDYYGKLYATGDIVRLFAKEHTGLLDRDEREQLEQRFKAAEPRPGDPNLLSCTPTLEMGIDIGDLSSVILCSVPPAQTKYLQRIGRAGRRDGNALNLTVANARPHDLYFFAEPEEMVAGRVEAPGVFLNASAVLERQFTAFCFDRWVESGIKQTDLPATVGQVLSSLEPVNPGTFPYTLLRFIETHQTELFDRFVEMFAQELTPDSIQHLHTFVEGDQEQQAGLQYRIVDGLRSLVRERDSLRKKIRTLQDKIRRKEKEPVQDKNTAQDLGELKQERNALQELVRRLNDCETLQFFTHQGLLPNYAFPEAGVQLQSIIYSKRESVQDGERRYETKIYEYVRPAASAIEELAPANHFYAGGRRVQVDQVDMAVSEIQTWRLCDNCSYMELVGKEDEKPVCPSCGSRLWADAGQKRPLLRMRQVFATTANQQSLIGDDSDDREPTFYTTQMLVNFDERDITDAYSVENDGLPFGFEFLSRATFREINFGEKGETGESVTIAGVALPRQGFPLCRVCGKIQNNPEKPSHALTCVARDQSSEKNLTDCVYLYREFTSEAIRILLPVTTFAGSERKLHSFVAALQLGLKRQFSGNIDHLHVTTCDEPIADSSYSKKYLVLYDTVPGGTGYLKQLMRSEAPLLDVFEYALAALRACSCNQDPNKDGCYRCLFAYRRSYTMPATSRETAVEVLSDILLYRDALVKVPTLRNVPVNALFDSELEARFIEALRRTGPDEDVPVSLSKELVNGKPGYFFKIGERAYYIEPQVTLGTTEGVPVACKADFVFRPARAQDKTLPIAVFTDGYRYHQDRVGPDMAQRMAIVSSGRFHVWSLTWKDVENRYRPQGDYFQNYLNPHAAPNGANFSQLLDGYQLDAFRDVHTKDSFTWLLRFLERPAADPWRRYAFVHGLLMLDPPRFSSPAAIQEWTGRIDEILPDDISTLLNEIGEPRLYGWSEPRDQAELVVLRLGAVVEAAAIQPPIDPARMLVAACLEDGQISRQGTDFEAVWNGYLRLYNLFQFLPLTIFVSREGLAAGAYAALRLKPTPAMSAAAPSEEWEAIRSVTGLELHTLLAQLEAQACPVPDVGYELVDVEGEIVATAELGWPTLQIAFLTEEEREYEPVFTSAGWRTFPLTELQAVDEAAAAVFTSPDAAALL